MKFKLLIILSLLVFLVSCSNIEGSMETKESSIFQVSEVKNCRITADKLNVRAGAGEKFNQIGTLNKNDEVDVLGQIGDWYVIQLDNNKVGCIKSEDAQPIVKENEPPTPTQPTERPQEPQQTPAPAKTPNTPVEGLTSLEQEMINLVNSERKKNNLPALKVNSELTRVARIKSQDMVDNNYFSHYSPTYGSPFDMLKSFGIEYLYAGENIAANSTVQKAHTSLMNSSGHRQNILSPNFTDIGIGIKQSKRYGYIFTQIFIGKPQ